MFNTDIICMALRIVDHIMSSRSITKRVYVIIKYKKVIKIVYHVNYKIILVSKLFFKKKFGLTKHRLRLIMFLPSRI